MSLHVHQTPHGAFLSMVRLTGITRSRTNTLEREKRERGRKNREKERGGGVKNDPLSRFTEIMYN